MTKKAVLKKDLGKLKQGTILHYTSGVFAHKGHTFMAEDVYFDESHFEVIEMTQSDISSESVDTIAKNSVFDIFLQPQLASVVTD